MNVENQGSTFYANRLGRAAAVTPRSQNPGPAWICILRVMAEASAERRGIVIMYPKKSGRIYLMLTAAAAIATVTIPAGSASAQSVPAPPSNLRVTPTANNTFLLTWQDNSNNESGFEITDGISFRLAGANATADNWHVTPNTYKCFRVRAYNAAGASAWYPSAAPYYVCGTTPAY